ARPWDRGSRNGSAPPSATSCISSIRRRTGRPIRQCYSRLGPLPVAYYLHNALAERIDARIELLVALRDARLIGIKVCSPGFAAGSGSFPSGPARTRSPDRPGRGG